MIKRAEVAGRLCVDCIVIFLKIDNMEFARKAIIFVGDILAKLIFLFILRYL